MKKTITYILYTLVLCAVVACDNGDREIVEPMYDKVVFNAVADSPSTRTALIFGGGKYQATWKAGDTFRIVQIANGEKSVYSGTVAEDCLRLSSIAEFETKIADEYVYLFGYPTLSMNSLCTYVAFTLPAEQNPTTIDTFDGNADMLLSECVVRKSQPIGESIRFNIKRLSSIGKFTVKNLALAEGDKVKSVTFSCTKPISGEITNLQLSDLMAGDISIENSTFVEDQNYNYVKVSLAEPQSEEFTYYMSCWPTTLAAGEQYTIVIETEQDEYVKTATLPFDLVFEQNEITTLTVNMAGVVAKNAAPATYKILYTSTDGNVITPTATDVFGAKIMSNTYENGQGEIVFDSDVTKIGDGAFCESRKLASVIIPDSVTEIGTEAFKFCTALTDITIGNSVTTIGQNAFRGCTYIESITIPDSVTTIGVSAFYNCNKLANVTIGNSVTTIGEAAFYNCNNLETISIPSSVVTIGASAFCSTALVGVTIPEGVTTIGSGAFSYCAALASVTMSSSVTTIGDSAFNECSSLAAVYISDLSAWCKLSFNVETSIATNPLYNGATLYLNGNAIAELTIPADITEVKSYAFIGCGSLVKVTIPDSVTTIGELAFRNCDALTEAIVGDGVITIEDSVFRNCSGLTSVTIGNSVTTMGDTVFYGCSGLTSVTISENVTKLGKQVFYDCTRLASVYCKPLTPPSLYTEVFENNATDRKFYVPAESLDAYKTASGWRLYADAIEVDPESVVEIDLSQYTDLSAEGTANCYLIQATGNYKLKAVKGNSTVSVGDAQSASVLWETFGTATTPNVGDLIASAGYQDGYVYFSTPTNFANGNASIAVRDSSGTILWSWHIWCSAEGWEDDVYANNAGTMMDRNLGATSATPGSVGALGLLYQWGRKDPFLGASSISADALAVSTGNWTTNSSQQTVEGTCQNPTIFIYTSDAQDWCIGDGYGDSNYDLRWKDTEKTAYDPCPIGYRVPKGGFWATANTTTLWDSTNYGLSWTIADGTTAWYPAVGYLNYDGSLRYVGSNSCCWSASPRPGYTDQAYSLVFWAVDSVYPTNHPQRMLGVSVRCVREGSDSGSSTPDPEPTPDPEVDLSQYTDLSAEGTANCYLVKSAGNYKLKAVKGNSTTSVGDVQRASVLWETFGTDVKPNVGDLVTNAGYQDGYVYFSTPTTFTNGNASIAVRDANNTILWSWHIWCSAEGWEDDVYTNNAGTLMDRNLGATSATPGSVGAFGLLYQWGRKDPFLGSSSISADALAVSTGNWTTNSSQQTVEYACQNPTTFICDNAEWCTGDGSGDSNYALRWKDAEKTAYDPCPVGYRVSKGGSDGLWKTSETTTSWDSSNKGRNWTLADGTTAWYPAVGYRRNNSGALLDVGSYGCYWSASPNPNDSNYAYYLLFYSSNVYPAFNNLRGYGFSLRCVREGSDSGSSTPDPEVPDTHKILYTSTDGKVVTPYITDIFGANIVSNTYENGQGVITFDADVTSIGYAAFYRCSSLTSITIPDSVTSIGNYAFQYCSSLTSVTIPDSVTSIGNGAFANCGSLQAFYGKYASSDNRCLVIDGVLNSFAPSGLTSYTIPDSITSIGDYAFYQCSSLISVTIPESVTSIGDSAFDYCSSLTSITIPDSVTAIGNYAFSSCSSLTSVIIGNSVTSIGNSAFHSCSSLTSVTIGNSVTSIGDSTFKDCSSLTSVYCKPLTPPSLYTEVFENNATDRKFYVPAEAVDAYKTATNWSTYADAIVVDPESVVEVDLSQYTDLSAEGTANCYLVKGTGNYKLKAVKGNSDTSVGDAQRAGVLWETFGTDVKPNVGDLIASAGYQDGYVYFSTPSNFANGNASIAVHDSNNTILWSWHIWCSAEGWEDDVYANNAGTMMDRNLGATSATPGSVGALGLLYQWGRKDPFLGASSISADALAVSTGNWTTNSSQQTVEYACQNPTIFICPIEWCTGDGAGDSNYDLRWKDTEKTAYDPCPVGYRVPKGGSDCLWKTSETTTSWDSSNKGRNWTLADGTTTWYPAVGRRSYDSGSLLNVGEYGFCWSASPRPSTNLAYDLYFNFAGNVYPAYSNYRGYGFSVRCVRE